MFSAMFL